MPVEKNAPNKAPIKRKGQKPAAAPAKPPVEPDTLMTTTIATVEWARRRRKPLAIAAGVLVVAIAGFVGWSFYRSAREEKASTLIAKGVNAELMPLSEGDPDVDKKLGLFKVDSEREQAALDAFGEARQKYGDTGPGILARLGEAGVHLDKHEWDESITAYQDVQASSLGKADANVRMRCIEGIGYAREGKSLLDDARRSFEELSNIDAPGAKPLGLYHMARIDLAKGNPKGALDGLKQARDIVLAPGGPSAQFLKIMIEKTMIRIDPASVPKPPPGGGPGALNGLQGMPGGPGGDHAYSQEELQKLLDQYKAAAGGSMAIPPTPAPAPAPKAS